jgi:hypothetical protein
MRRYDQAARLPIAGSPLRQEPSAGKPDTVILTGTPQGIGFARKPLVFLQSTTDQRK